MIPIIAGPRRSLSKEPITICGLRACSLKPIDIITTHQLNKIKERPTYGIAESMTICRESNNSGLIGSKCALSSNGRRNLFGLGQFLPVHHCFPLVQKRRINAADQISQPRNHGFKFLSHDFFRDHLTHHSIGITEIAQNDAL